MTEQKKNFLRNSKGSILVLAALTAPVFIGFVALGVDVSLWYKNKRQLQLVSDAIAYGATLALNKRQNVAAYATNDAGLNSVSVANGNTITVQNPPTSGTYNGNSKAVQVLLTSPGKVYFTGYFLPNAFSLHSQSVALLIPPISCITTLDTTASQSLTLKGATVTLYQCGSYVNSSSSDAVDLGNNSTLTTQFLNIVGNYQSSGQIQSTIPIVTNATATLDPYINLPAPTFSGCNFNNYSAPNSSSTINPGVYCSGLSIGSSSIVTFNPGIYIIDRGTFSVSSGAIVQGTGVTIFLTSSTGTNYASMQFSSNSTITLTSSSSGTYQGVLAFSPSAASGVTHSFSSGTNLALNGALYFPTSYVDFTSGSSNNACLQIVAQQVKFSSKGLFYFGGTNCSTSSSGIPSFKLVE